MWVDVEQNSEEWFGLRLGKATSSKFATIMANYGKAFGNPAIEYAQEVARERVTFQRNELGYKNQFMDFGHEWEDYARQRYEEEEFETVSNGGFFHNGTLLDGSDGIIGDSNDGNVGDKGCIEIKCVQPNTHWKRLKKKGYDSAYKWQIQGHLWLGQKEWCDFISFCPLMPENKQLYVFRVKRDENMISQMKERILGEFMREVDRNINILQNA